MKEKVLIQNEAPKDGMAFIQPTVVFYAIQDAVDKGYRIISLQGSARSGKTYNTTIWYCTYAYNNAGVRVSVVRATMPRLKKTAYEDFKDVMRKLHKWEAARMNEKDMVYTMHNGSVITFFATEDAGAAQGLKSDVAFINEATEIDYPVYNQIAMRTQGTDERRGVIILDYNPNFADDHWIAKLNREPSLDKQRFFFKTTYKDNPYLPKDQIKFIENYQNTDLRLWRIYGLGEQCMVEGLIYDNYNVCEKIPDRLYRRAVVGVDWGYNDPYAVTLVAIDQNRRELYLQEVCYKSRMSDDEQRDVLLKPPCAGRLVICDNAEPQLIRKMREAGVRIQGAKKITAASRKSIIPGISVMKSYKIFITEDSTNGLMEANNYTWKRDRNGDWMKEPIDKFNHFWDSARYVVYTLGTHGRFGNRFRSIRING